MSSVTIHLTPDTERRLREQAAQSGESLESLLQRLVEQAAAAVNGTAQKPDAELTPEQWSAEWHAWAANHKATPGVLDDSREGIYAGRGKCVPF